jgi:hypothetical protein
MPRVKKSVSSSENVITIVSTSDIVIENVVKLKRGRKSKKELEELNKQNINCSIDEKIINSVSLDDINNTNEINEILTINLEIENDIKNNFENDNDNDNDKDNVKSVTKKRGRKPKGGKIIQQIFPLINNKETKSNVILHLKCSIKDLVNNSSINYNIESFDFDSCKNDLNYELIEKPNKNYNDYNNNINNDDDNEYECSNTNTNTNTNNETNIKEIWKKLKQLEHNLHTNNISNKKSCCFWCTCDFDNPQIYIPKYFIKESYHVYGCFCSPECATAHLMDENIDSSTKFERYHLLNHIYAKIYNYTKNIKPAPNPYYILDKFCGNLNIQEYRALLNNERLFLIVDKPLTRILPELHEDNDDFIINNKIIPSNTYQIKKKIQKKTNTKNNIVNEKFGLAQ